MNKKLIVQLLMLVFCLFGGYLLYNKFTSAPVKPLFSTKNPEIKDISRSITMSGYLEIKDTIRIGSLVAGTVTAIHVKEHGHVKKGQLLAVLNIVKGDTDVRNAQGELEKTKATYDYKSKNYERQQKLYKAGFVAQDEFERITQDYLIACGDLKSKQALLDKAKIELENCKIIAPADGTIIAIGITEGIRITTDLDATVLFEIARDRTKMEAILEIDESEVGSIHPGQAAKVTADSLPYHAFKGVVESVSYSPCKSREEQKKRAGSCYEACLTIDNDEELLKPGLAISAQIILKKLKQVIAMANSAFYVNPAHVKTIASILGYKCVQLSKAEKHDVKKTKKSGVVKFAWVVKEKSFIETPVLVDISNDTHFAVIEGLMLDDLVITGVDGPNEMDEYYKKAFKTL